MISIEALMAPARPRATTISMSSKWNNFLRPEDAGGQQDGLAVREPGREGAFCDKRPIRLVEDRFDEVTESDHRHEGRDDHFQGAEAVAFQAEDQKGDDGGD